MTTTSDHKASGLDHQVSGLLAAAMFAAVNGDLGKSFKLIGTIDVWSLRTQLGQFHSRNRSSVRKNDESVEQLDQSRKLGYFCIYCGKRTVDLRVLRLFSSCFQNVLPYEKNWAYSHIVYWTHSASIEHHQPSSRSGQDTGTNIQTSCYQCNEIKNNRLHTELGWDVACISEADPDWDGLQSLIAPLKEVLRPITKVPTLPVDMRPLVAHLTRKPIRMSTPPPTSKPKMSRARRLVNCDPLLLKEGNFVRLRRPGKVSRRSYRVDSVDNLVAVIREMWRSGEKWVASSTRITVDLKEC